MKCEIVKTKKLEGLIFEDVKNDEAFLNEDGFLCFKSTHNSYAAILDVNGKPYIDYRQDIPPDIEVKEILGFPVKIEFER